jgi:hypothetical protein
MFFSEGVFYVGYTFFTICTCNCTSSLFASYRMDILSAMKMLMLVFWVMPCGLGEYLQVHMVLQPKRPTSICVESFGFTDTVHELLQNRLITLIHNMGGSIRRDMVSKVTHLIANSCGGDKYQYAVTFRVPVMSETWVYAMWEKRKETAVSAASEEMVRITPTCYLDVGLNRIVQMLSVFQS